MMLPPWLRLRADFRDVLGTGGTWGLRGVYWGNIGIMELKMETTIMLL